MNPIWTPIIIEAIKKVERRCTHCGKTSTYDRKKRGQFYNCKSCGHRFMEKGK
ncbi:MAG: hypothetical protein L0229_08035 [Blastocatellia bacterium]|nr:hypothetical protein [Blastocatellia bacterium]